ncbi:hypothetical protein Rs2_26421 [Raphanus sativus]|nr:hypothetical protein Rs2_26421 [Raphanus sativus]
MVQVENSETETHDGAEKKDFSTPPSCSTHSPVATPQKDNSTTFCNSSLDAKSTTSYTLAGASSAHTSLQIMDDVPSDIIINEGIAHSRNDPSTMTFLSTESNQAIGGMESDFHIAEQMDELGKSGWKRLNKKILNYESKTSVTDSKTSGSFSIQIRQVERCFARLSGSSSENLAAQKTLASSSTPIVFEIPSSFLLGGEEICSAYVANALSETAIDNSIQLLILPNICKQALALSKTLESGFLVDALAEVVQETYLNDFVDVNDYDSEGQKIPTEPDCAICLREFGDQTSTKLHCDHIFHRDCILTWLRRKSSCPTCRDDIHNPRAKKHTPKKYIGRDYMITNYHAQ